MRNLLNLFRDHGVNLRGVALMALLSLDAVLIGAGVTVLALRGVLPPLDAWAMLPLTLCAASLLSSDLWQTDEERLDRWLGLSFHGEHRVACAKAYDDLWIDEVDA
ncbi:MULTISPECIES: hypothetical protein [Burkholderia cepacia complex]|uniref:Uncharacterized protein n=1 Tax=Burkholderia pseudomultivorans TaxID=1207504 RepID=A0ABU2ED41_9BURK|nr:MULTISPECIES: hypothetical protein [Burkholderia cepacia complex]MDR8731320.1 hypothetical protein [Burkholderia pseudomultivorans]MDR8738941.1 hypothetical protein [Burkholderia pseudomultivorans]MDR8745492.1 hypothetical protein [Burkholderia pseudomultivorans]MDR8757806.1 hypothetical protein [Burkholderia pseudomultivorans]MDR8781906.1 hypothetical protein [Burkholderia pseudomultivorans]